MAVQRDKVIASAEKLVAKGKIEPAIKEYERLLEDNPNDVNTLNRIGDLWVRINRNDEAVKVFGKIADHYSRDGFFLKAIAIYKKINKLDPSKLEIYARLADLYAKQGLAMEAKSQYQVLADYYLKHGEPGNALQIYRKISELDPNSINVHVKLADLYSQVNQTVEALKEYDRVGRMLLKRGMLEEAVQVYRKALKIDPKNTELVDSLITALLEARDFENARQIIDLALEATPGSPRLLSMQGRIQLGKGDVAAARSTLERANAADPDDPSVRDGLAELYLKQGDPDRALEMMAPLVEKAMSRGERHAAIEFLNRILRVHAAHAPTLERLVAVYTRLNEETNILASMNSLAEAHIARGAFEDAGRVLESLIQREPQNSQHRTKLKFIHSQIGGVETLPPRRGSDTPVSLPALEIDEPAPTFDVGAASEPEIEFDFNASGGGVDFSLDETPAPEPVVAPPPPLQRLKPAVEVAATDLAETNDDLDFITEHLTEAEVFAKYGLAEKAAEHLRAVLERAPKNLTAHERLFRILLEEGDTEGGRTAAIAYVALLEEKGDSATIAVVRNEFSSRGHVLGASGAAVPAWAPASDALSLDLDSPSDEITLDLDGGLPEIEFEIEEGEPVDALADEQTFTLDEQPEPSGSALDPGALDDIRPADVQGLTFDQDFAAEAGVAAEDDFTFLGGAPPEVLPETIDIEEAATLDLDGIEELTADQLTVESQADPGGEPLVFEPEPELLDRDSPAPASETLIPEPLEDGSLTQEGEAESTFRELVDDFDAPDFGQPESPLVLDEPATFLELEEQEAFGQAEDAGAPAGPFTEGPGTGAVPVDALGEIDFYIEQELFDEARRKLDALATRFPNDASLASRRSRVEAASGAAGAARPSILSRDEIESELLSAIPDDDEELSLAPPPELPAAPQSPFAAAAVKEENLFADEENFFDLAAELESELAEDDEAISLSEEEQSLEEIFKEFKKGVEQQLDSEDYDTHYNLGIAYKEMGLIDEAIGEFQLASKDPKRAVECASMLGLCFLEKGMPQLAIKWYRKGLEMPEISEDEHVGLLYDLGSAFQEVGDTENAEKAFMEVYGMNSNYRDTVSRIKALEDSRR